MNEPENRRLPRPATVPTRADEVWDAIVHAVPDWRQRPEALDAYTPAIRQVHAMSLLTAEVNNGGFSQFMFNGGGIWFDDAIEGFAAAGLGEHSKLADKAAAAGAAQIDALVTAQRGSLEGYAAWAQSSGLGEFDDRWYDLPDPEPALDQFVRDHASDIWAE